MQGLERRLVRLELASRSGESWRAWAHTPMQHWPDSALEGFILASAAEQEELPEHIWADLRRQALSDETLRFFAEEAAPDAQRA